MLMVEAGTTLSAFMKIFVLLGFVSCILIFTQVPLEDNHSVHRFRFSSCVQTGL